MQNNYINPMVKNRIDINANRRAMAHYRSFRDKVGEKNFYRAIQKVREAENKGILKDFEIFMAYERTVKIIALTKKYNITRDVAEIMVDLNMPFTSVIQAEVICKFGLKNNPNAMDLSRVIVDRKLDGNLNAVIIAERILKHNLNDYPDAVNIVNMVYEFGIPLDLAIEVSKYDNYNYEFKHQNERYIFHKLRQIYRVKMKVDKTINIEREADRISTTLAIDPDKAKYLLYCCMSDNWGRNSCVYWDYSSFKCDFANDYDYADDVNFIYDYISDSSINSYARGFEIIDKHTYYNASGRGDLLENKDIIDKYNYEFLPLYRAANKYSLPNKATNKYSLGKDVIVFRGTPIDALNKYGVKPDDSEEEIKRKLNGYYQDGGFVSTSVVVDSEEFLFETVNFIINLKSGTPCCELSKYSNFPEECEILIPPNVVFRVDDVKRVSEGPVDKILIYLTSIPTKSLSYVGSINEKENTDDGHKQK